LFLLGSRIRGNDEPGVFRGAQRSGIQKNFKNCPAGLKGNKMTNIQQAKYIGQHKIWLKFDDGQEGIVDLADIPDRYPAAKPLKDENVFASFYLDEWPTLAWECGFDLAPETLYERLTGQQPAWLNEVAAAA
jgi:hypothetical protein